MGRLVLLAEGEQGGLPDYQIAKQKPSPLSDAFDRAYFDGLFDENTAKLTAKAFLATEQRIPGLGNGVSAGHPLDGENPPEAQDGRAFAPATSGMYDAVKSVLRAMAAQGGRDTEKDLFGCPGGYNTILSKNTVGKPCPECGTLIQKEPYLGGSIYYCAGCQKK